MKFLDLEDGSPKAILAVLLVLGIRFLMAQNP